MSSRAIGWSQCDELLEEMGGDGDIINLKNDKDFVVCVFLGEPFGRKMIWTGKRFIEEPEGQEVEGRKSARFMFNIWVTKARIEGETMEINDLRAIEMSKKTFQKALMPGKAKYSAKNGGFDKCLFEYKRDGKPGDQQTVYNCLFEERISEGLEASLADLELIDLPTLATQLSGGSGGAPILPASQPTGRIAGPGSGRGLIDARSAGDITARLRALGVEKAGEFKAALNIRTVREIKEDQRPAALQMLGDLEAEAGIVSDPFA